MLPSIKRQALSESDKQILDRNLARWFARCSRAERFCCHCGLAMDPDFTGATRLEKRCEVCADMESLLWAKLYWQNIDRFEKKRRKEMGLDGEALA